MKQQDLFLNRGHGGARMGAGRPRKDKSLQLHLPRPELKKSHPLHINVKLVKGLPNLRRKKYFQLIKRSLKMANKKSLKVVHFSIQSNHIHLLVETSDKKNLARGMQSFCTSLAKLLNSRWGRKGQIFRDRYHLHILKTAREVRNALVYVFQNYAKHTKTPHRFDPFSTLLCFPEKNRLGLARVNTHSCFSSQSTRESYQQELQELIESPSTWLLRVGWKKAL